MNQALLELYEHSTAQLPWPTGLAFYGAAMMFKRQAFVAFDMTKGEWI